ncbi:MAG: PQQ-binding-like beta-propeller repeat protein [Bacteroidota bacterium]|nr:PQQ-binding-like beta-propeller repeat protein [Bacteroidota bacterium]
MSEEKSALRLWPGIVTILLQWLLMFVLPAIVPKAMAIGLMSGLFCGLLIVVWWAFFSRAPRFERWSAPLLMLIAMILTSRLLHESIQTGNMGMMFAIYATPVLCLAFVLWAVVCRHLGTGPRRILMMVSILLACGIWILVRSDGIFGYGVPDFTWRWAPTSEERLLATAVMEASEPMSSLDGTEAGYHWPGFRGINRDGIIHDLKIETDWSASPPVELWRRPIGPGCSSFAVRGNMIYTQEQRGEEEIVSCYYLVTGEPVWKHRDQARFWDSHVGAGPRSTPTLADSCLYTLGATGILNALDVVNGNLLWSRNAAADTDTETREWGYTASPLVVDDVVIIALSGKLIAYERTNGDPRWQGPDGGSGYSSPHLVNMHGVRQILLMSRAGVTSVAPADGSLLWEHEWLEGDKIMQPALITDGDLLISAGLRKGMRRIGVSHGPDGWITDEHWTSIRMRPNFNDFIVHKGHVYGFDGPNLVCMDLEDGKRKWRGDRYTGQLLLLAEQNLLLVWSEEGQVALVEAVPDGFTKLGRFQAVEGKAWSHPAMAGNIFLARNDKEMVAYRLPLEE